MPVVGARPPGELEQQPGLANARLARYERHTAVPAPGALEQTGKRGQLAVTADE